MVPVRLRERNRDAGEGRISWPAKGENTLWLPDKEKCGPGREEARYPHDVRAPGLCCVAVHESPVYRPEPSRLEELWWSRYNSLSEVADLIRGLLG